MPTTTHAAFDREALAEWYANRHLDIDAGLVRVLHLPAGAPPREIRLLEVNRLVPATTPLEPVDFGVAIDGPDAHTLYVLDLTPAQWDDVQAGALPLPAGWSLQGSRELARRP